MFNLPEILTIVIGVLLALVFIDGIRRAIRIKRSSLKVDLIDVDEYASKDFEEEWMQGFSDEPSKEDSEEEVEESSLDIKTSNSLLILHLGSLKKDQFSKHSITQALNEFDFVYEEKGFFTLLDANGNIAFSIFNGKKPGTFLEDTASDDLALVLDTVNLSSPLESFDLLIDVSQHLKGFFEVELLDEDRNLLTKQMIEHMRQKVLEYKRQFLASTG
jgi:FtsZ-interacting cell division protein ZipA